MLAQLLAFHHPELASGLVLVDPAHQDMNAARSALLTRGMFAPLRRARARRTVTHFSADPRIRALAAAAYGSIPARPGELGGLAASLPLIRQLR